MKEAIKDIFPMILFAGRGKTSLPQIPKSTWSPDQVSERMWGITHPQAYQKRANRSR
jgi:hypothetical protein